MKKNILWFMLICLLAPGFLFYGPNEAQAASETQTAEKLLLAAPEIMKAKFQNLVSQGLLTEEQADKIFLQLNTAKSPTSKQEITADDLKNRLDSLLKSNIINKAQAYIAAQAVCKNLPEGFAEIPSLTAVYAQKGKIVNKTKQDYTGRCQNQSAIFVSHNGGLTLTNSVITSSGSSSFETGSNFLGLNAAVLAHSGAHINLADSKIATIGDGAHAVFATGAASTVNLANSKIATAGDASCGLTATAKGTIQAENIDIATSGKYAPAIAADRINGTVAVHNARITTAGADSPGIYSIGTIKVSDAKVTAENAEGAIIEGRSSLELANTAVSCAKNQGVLMFQGYTGKLEQGSASFIMNGGSLTAKEGPAFYVTNIEGHIQLTNAAIIASSKKLLEVAAGKWGEKGSNGGNLDFTAVKETLTGSIFCDNISTLTIKLKDYTTLTGTINAIRTAGLVNLILDNTSIWQVSGDSYLSSLSDADISFSNIQDNGFSIYYNARLDANKWLGGKTYTLKNGGKLAPSPQL
jgi:hypothetical protein